MPSRLIRTLSFAQGWVRPDVGLQSDEIVLEGPAGRFDATRLRPVRAGSGPAWILLHGITRPGRRHRSLMRLAQALAGSGATVVIPEIPEWVALQLAPRRARDATLAALAGLETDPRVTAPPGLMGFSFGAPQALRLASDPVVGSRIACATGFGGYANLERALRFLWSGRHEWEGRSYRTRPDPYGRWVVGANFLTRIPGLSAAGDVAETLRRLARIAGDRRVPSWDPSLEPLKDALAREVAPEHRALFRSFVPPLESEPPAPEGDPEDWGGRLAVAAEAAEPLLSLPPVVEARVPVFLLHGRHDHLIPFTETLWMESRIRSPETTVSVTGLFGHSAGDPRPRPRPRGAGEWARELGRLGRALSRLLTAV
ncbi:MAG: hypothetical protein P8188_06025 [Gemmatimonadota bacterium]